MVLRPASSCPACLLSPVSIEWFCFAAPLPARLHITGLNSPWRVPSLPPDAPVPSREMIRRHPIAHTNHEENRNHVAIWRLSKVGLHTEVPYTEYLTVQKATRRHDATTARHYDKCRRITTGYDKLQYMYYDKL